MSLYQRHLGKSKNVYLYFRMGKDQIYLGPEDSVNPEKIHEAISYVNMRLDHYKKILDNLQKLKVGPFEEPVVKSRRTIIGSKLLRNPFLNYSNTTKD